MQPQAKLERCSNQSRDTTRNLKSKGTTQWQPKLEQRDTESRRANPSQRPTERHEEPKDEGPMQLQAKMKRRDTEQRRTASQGTDPTESGATDTAKCQSGAVQLSDTRKKEMKAKEADGRNCKP